MALTYVYVYSPVSGSIVGIPAGYCSCSPPSNCPHPSVCLTQPFDVSCPGGTPIQFKASSDIKSIRTTYYGYGVCYRSEVPTPWDAKMKVDFYLQPNGQYWAGSVCYAHINSPVANGVYNVNTKTIGYIPGSCSCSCGSGCKCGGYRGLESERGYCASQSGLCSPTCPCVCCYGGPHTHMERDSSGESKSLTCWTQVYTSTWIYRWYVELP